MAGQVRFTETMEGWVAPAPGPDRPVGAGSAARSGSPAAFTLTVLTPDVDRMIADPDHRSPAFGVVECAALAPAPLAVTAGHLDLFADAGPGVVHMRYELHLLGPDGGRYTLRGVKDVRRRRWWPTVLTDTTTLAVELWSGPPAGPPTLRGELRMGPGAVIAQGLTFRGGVGAIVRYLAYYVRRCVTVYLGPRTPR